MWATDFFQAVSHKRFANRAYFAFAQKQSIVSKIPLDLQYYHEIFGVGVIVISIEDDHFDEIHDLAKPPSLVPEKAEIRELFPAPYNIALPIFQKRYLDALEIRDNESLFKFGKGNI
jgi:hypothetical protein